MKPRKIRKTVKRFLSDTPNEYATVCYEINVDPDDRYELLDATLRITDCMTNVNISFGAIKKEHLAKRVKKLDVLIKTLQELRDTITSENVSNVIQYKIEHKTKKGTKE